MGVPQSMLTDWTTMKKRDGITDYDSDTLDEIARYTSRHAKAKADKVLAETRKLNPPVGLPLPRSTRSTPKKSRLPWFDLLLWSCLAYLLIFSYLKLF